MVTKSIPPASLANPPRSRTTGNKSRHVAELSNVPLLGRTALVSRIQQVASREPNARFPNLRAFLQFWKWLPHYLHDFLHEKAPYQTYPIGKSGIFDVAAPGDGPLRIAVAADWGTGTLEAETVAHNIRNCSPHYTLHLGDVYYMGEATEVRENCLGERRHNYTGVHWPMGSHGSFALMGNHEMYSGGQGYFRQLLPGLGVLKESHMVGDPQSASYFCLETEHWVVLGLDTGYHSGGVPWLTTVPLINRIPFLNVDARFDEKMLGWLQRTMNAMREKGSRDKPILLLTHHQPVSSFEHPYAKPAEQLARPELLSGREFVWIYGHEHRLTIYKKQTVAGTLSVYPRCIGHGGMPVEATELEKPDPRILYYDPRQHAIDVDHLDTMVGYNGHIVLLLEGLELRIEYRDILQNNLLYTESFRPDESGALQYSCSLPKDSPLRSGVEPV